MIIALKTPLGVYPEDNDAFIMCNIVFSIKGRSSIISFVGMVYNEQTENLGLITNVDNSLAVARANRPRC